jgi:predicted nucleic acid-binding protein
VAGALEVAISHGISVDDATYVHLARTRALPLWTLDLKLARAVAGTIDVRVPVSV